MRKPKSPTIQQTRKARAEQDRARTVQGIKTAIRHRRIERAWNLTGVILIVIWCATTGAASVAALLYLVKRL